VSECSAVQCKEVKSLDLESVKRRVESWCQMAASLGVKSVGAMSQLWDISQMVRT
jgi:hypothetical protein